MVRGLFPNTLKCFCSSGIGLGSQAFHGRYLLSVRSSSGARVLAGFRWLLLGMPPGISIGGGC